MTALGRAIPTVSPAGIDLLLRAREAGDRLDTANLNARFVVELLAADLAEVQRGIMVLTDNGRLICQVLANGTKP